ncbi:MAG: dihydroneopterin aldolase family protein [Thermoplasmata archaeon]|nr:dihydroneopterin aldolase family protein [Thermoplasmata archaeon]
MNSPRRRSLHRVPLSLREALLFEAGIKLGGIFHQYLGIPVSPRTAGPLARSIESAVELQPFVDRVRVRIVPARGGAMGRGRFGYRYVTAEMIDAVVTLSDGGVRVVARLSYRADLRYPLMRVEALKSVPEKRRRSPT